MAETLIAILGLNLYYHEICKKYDTHNKLGLANTHAYCTPSSFEYFNLTNPTSSSYLYAKQDKRSMSKAMPLI